MSEINYKKRYEFQKDMIARQSEQIDLLKLEIGKLKFQCEEKDKIIHSVDSLRSELQDNIDDIKNKKEEYHKLIKELKTMRDVLNKNVFKGRWNLIKFLIR